MTTYVIDSEGMVDVTVIVEDNSGKLIKLYYLAIQWYFLPVQTIGSKHFLPCTFLRSLSNTVDSGY